MRYGVSVVAPRVLLGNYNVFPGLVGNARSEDITAALEAAYEDGFDVANMSLGGRNHSGRLGNQDILTGAVNHLDQPTMVVPMAARNAVPGVHTIRSADSAA